jgi:hypothetical protein
MSYLPHEYYILEPPLPTSLAQPNDTSWRELSDLQPFHCTYSATTPSGPWPPSADASTISRHLLVFLSYITTQFSAACSYILLLSQLYFLHNYVIGLNLRSSVIGRPLVRLSPIDDNPGFERRSVVQKMDFLYWSIQAKVSSSPQHRFTICGEVTQLLQLSDSSPTQQMGKHVQTRSILMCANWKLMLRDVTDRTDRCTFAQHIRV